MLQSTQAAPPYSVVLISDSGGGTIPDSMSGKAIAFTDSCIAVGCLSEADGETAFTLGGAHDVVGQGQVVFQGKIKTPNRVVVLSTVEGESILSTPVSMEETFVRIWTNDSDEPDNIVVAVE